MNKSAQSHVEMMLSFLLFISAIVFIFFYINPFAKTADNTNELNQVQKIIIENASAKVGRLSIVINSGGCYNFAPADYSNNNYIEISEPPKKYTIYFSEIFPSTHAPKKDENCDPSRYRLGIFLNDTIMSYDRLKSIASACKNDAGYKDTLRNLGIIMDFSFSCKDENGNVIDEISFTRRIPSSVQVDSKEFPIRLIKDDGSIINVIFNLKVW